MARITVEDCLKNNDIENRFELVVLASKRGKELAEGAKPMIEKDNDKNAVIALREIAAKQLDLDVIRKTFSENFHNNFSNEEDIAEEDDLKEHLYEEMGGLNIQPSDEELGFEIEEGSEDFDSEEDGEEEQ